jgi:hypothetical protein
MKNQRSWYWKIHWGLSQKPDVLGKNLQLKVYENKFSLRKELSLACFLLGCVIRALTIHRAGIILFALLKLEWSNGHIAWFFLLVRHFGEIFLKLKKKYHSPYLSFRVIAIPYNYQKRFHCFSSIQFHIVLTATWIKY